MSNKKVTPALTPRARENQLINLAYQQAEERLRNGTASSQIITALLHMGSMKTEMEYEKLKSDLKVANAKIAQMESEETTEERYNEVLKAFRSYKGFDEEEIDEYNQRL